MSSFKTDEVMAVAMKRKKARTTNDARFQGGKWHQHSMATTQQERRIKTGARKSAYSRNVNVGRRVSSKMTTTTMPSLSSSASQSWQKIEHVNFRRGWV